MYNISSCLHTNTPIDFNKNIGTYLLDVILSYKTVSQNVYFILQRFVLPAKHRQMLCLDFKLNNFRICQYSQVEVQLGTMYFNTRIAAHMHGLLLTLNDNILTLILSCSFAKAIDISTTHPKCRLELPALSCLFCIHLSIQPVQVSFTTI